MDFWIRHCTQRKSMTRKPAMAPVKISMDCSSLRVTWNFLRRLETWKKYWKIQMMVFVNLRKKEGVNKKIAFGKTSKAKIPIIEWSSRNVAEKFRICNWIRTNAVEIF